MALYALLFGAGRSAAANPNASVGGSGGLGLNNIDPIGNWITSKGGDPLNLYGHKDNPGALLFPGQAAGSGPPPPGSGGMMTGLSPGQDNGLMSAYATFLRNLGAPPMRGGGMPGMGGAPAPVTRQPINMGSDMRGAGPMNPVGNPNLAGLSSLFQFQNSQPTMPSSQMY